MQGKWPGNGSRESSRAQKTALTGALLQQQNGQLQLALASNVVALHKFLDTFVQQKFVVDDGALKEPLARPAPQARIAWNPAILAEAVELAGRYDTFVKMALTGLPAALEQALTQLALRHLDASMNARLSQAQDMAPMLSGYCRFSCRRCGATGSEEPQGGAPAPRHPGHDL